jgi:type VI secretion system protein ImpA
MPLRNDLLKPISEEQPSGENLRYAPVYDKIKEARREDDDAPQGLWQRERKLADWPITIKLIGETLATKTKDLQLVAWLAEAMLRREGVAGLREVLDLAKGMLETFWDTLHPELEDGDSELRVGPLQWVGDRLEIPLRQSGITKSGLSFFQYKESRAIGTEEAANQSNEKRIARAAAIAEGKIPQEDFDKSFDESPKTYYVSLLATYDGAMESLRGLKEVCDEKFGDASPNFGVLERTLEEVRQTVYILLQKKREKEPDAPEAAVAEPAPEPEAEPQIDAAPASVVRASSAAAAPARFDAFTSEPADRAAAVSAAVACARYLRRNEPTSPAPFLMLRGLRWGELRAGRGTLDERLLAAPSSELRQRLKRAALDSNWAEVLETAETAMGMECGRGWLDAQRYAIRACSELGYEAVRISLVSELRSLLRDYKQILGMTMMDDTPTANPETLAWIKQEVIASASTTEAAARASSHASAATGSSMEDSPDVFESAMRAARGGRANEGIELLMRELKHERSGRGRFLRKSQIAQICVAAGNQDIAFPILKELVSEIEQRKLEDWEDPPLVAKPLALLFQCLNPEIDAEERQRLYSWICRLDPLQALEVNR